VKTKLKLALALLICMAAFTTARAQKKDTIKVGTITGILRDSAHNYAMQSSTLSLYKVEGNELVAYQLTNNLGKYTMKEAPVGVKLRIIATHLGYISNRKEFTISPKTKAIDLGTMNLNKIDKALNEVVITAEVAPMQMRGDTLEFNAAAFKLDTNAVVEDLLRKLPGVTVWADGVITVNGRKINQLLVEGKSFFGGDNKIALQNIPKNSVKKIQVYTNKDDPDPMNPKTDMNIVLKKDKRDGFFGKFGIGGGTNKQYAADAMITYFSPKTNFSLVGAANDVNKRANDVNTLMGFNSFKGEGINNDYHSDFRQQGYNVFRGGGFTGSHDFSKEGDTRQSYYKTNMLKAEFFTSSTSNNTTSNSVSEETLPTTATDQTIYKVNRTSTGDRYSENLGIRSNASYEKRFQYGSLSASVNANNNRGNSSNTSISKAFNERSGIASTDTKQSTGDNSSNNISGSFRGSIQRQYDFGKRKYKWINLDINYNFSVGDGDNKSNEVTDFKSTDPKQNLYLDRLYNTNYQNSNHTLTTSFRGITELFAPKFRLFQIGLNNTIAIYDTRNNRQISNRDTLTNTYTINDTLTNISHYKTVDEKPGITFSRGFYKSLDNRYSKNWNISATAQGQMYSQRNTATQTVQNLDRTYYYFIPTANLGYSNYQYGDFSKRYNLSYSTNVQFPTVDQIAPIYDNSNIFDIPLGNPNLKPSYNHQLGFTYDYYDEKGKNAMNANIRLSAGITEDNIIDSSVYDNTIGRRIRTFVNGSGRRYVSYNGYINKAFQFKDHQIQLNGSSDFNFSRYASAVNGRMYTGNYTDGSLSAAATYTYKSIWTANVEEKVDGGKINQQGLSQNTYYTWSTRGGVAFAFPRSVFFNSRVEFNNTKSSGVRENVYYTILNADIGYRFLKGAEAEIKLSALDILRQNQSFRNYISANSVQSTRTNVLRQYFMLTLAYYPRKFGMKK
jgi:hypothetical protein